MAICHILLAMMLTVVPFAVNSMMFFNNVVKLTLENFEKEVGKDRAVLVSFFFPSFPYCAELEYEKTGASFKNAKHVLIAKVNCDEDGDLCDKYDSYPSFIFGTPFLWFPQYSLDAKRYLGPRTTEAFIELVNTEAGTMVKQTKFSSDLVILDEETFDPIVLDETKDVFVIFESYTPWRGDCGGHDIKYEKLASVYKLNENIVVAILNAYKYEGIAEKYHVEDYPNFLYFPKGNKDGQFSEGDISVDHFVDSINEIFGSSRNTKDQRNLEWPQMETVYAPPSTQTRARESDLDISAFVHVDGVITSEFSIGKVVQYVARKTWADPLDFKHQISGPRQWLLKFPERYQRDKFVDEESFARIEGSLVQFRSWKSDNSASPFLFKRRVRLKLHNFPEHHYCFEKAAFLVASFGSLVEVDMWKIQGDLSTLDVMVDVEDVLNIPKLKKYAYDNYFVREVRIEVIEDVDIQWYMELGLERMELSYVEKRYRSVKEAITAKMEAQCKV